MSWLVSEIYHDGSRLKKVISLQPISEATRRAMPDAMHTIVRELGEANISQLTEAEKAVLERIQHDLPRTVQNRALRKRKTPSPADWQ